MPEQTPRQPANTEPASAVGVSSTYVPESNDPEHVSPQSMPAGVETTRPVPLPRLVTVTPTSHAQREPISTAVSALPIWVHSAAVSAPEPVRSVHDCLIAASASRMLESAVRYTVSVRYRTRPALSR